MANGETLQILGLLGEVVETQQRVIDELKPPVARLDWRASLFRASGPATVRETG
jgi:hypothetical protein